MNINRKNAIIVVAVILTMILGVFAVSFYNSLHGSPEKAEKESLSPSPSATPSIVPTPESTPEPEPVTATIVSAGDCVLHKLFQESALIGDDKYDFYPIFEAIKPYTEPASYSLISFESASTNKRNDYTGYPLFNCPPEIFDAFKKVGLDMVNNSNNHQLDRKLSGMFETRDNIQKAGLEVAGIYDGEEPRYLIKDLNGIKVAIMAYTYSCNMNELALTEEQRYNHLSLIDEERMKKEITEMEEKADVTVIAMHWGVEYTQKPNDSQKRLARDMISWGADVILGSHPHVVQPSEIISHEGEDKYVIYSMGNFVSNQRRGASGYPKTHKELCEDSMLVHIEFLKDPKTGKTVIQKVDHIPTWLWRYSENNRYKFKVIPVPELDYYKNGEYPEEALYEAYESYKRTMSLVTDYVRE
ncbi:MAG: CapA family protein [Clostridiaceae bacterium]|nr:CapA family protein [Clostridiaceae bacterium]